MMPLESSVSDTTIWSVALKSSIMILEASLTLIYDAHSTITEPLQKGKDQYSWPPCTNLFRSAPFYIENFIYPPYKQATLTRRSTVLSLPFQLVFPGTLV